MEFRGAEFHQNNCTQVQGGGQLANSGGTDEILASDRDSVMAQCKKVIVKATLRWSRFRTQVFLNESVSQLTDVNL